VIPEALTSFRQEVKIMHKIVLIVAACSVAGSLQAEIAIKATVERPGELEIKPPVSTLGSLISDQKLPTTTYTLKGLDLTGVGGKANEEIVFAVAYTQNGGTGVQFNSFRNVSVTGGVDDNQVDPGETLTATVSLVSTSFEGGNLSKLSIGFTCVRLGGFGRDQANITHAGGTEFKDGRKDTEPTLKISKSTAFTIATKKGEINIQGFEVQITVSTEAPVSYAFCQSAKMATGI
jgi:hypothetical protein